MELLLRNKRVLLFAFSLFILAAGCNNETNKPVEKEEAAECKAPEEGMNPNGSSELSQLMRQMQSAADSAKQMIRNGDVPRNFPEAFLKIHTAQPTDSDTKKESFDGFATHYLNSLKTLYSSSKADAPKHYNAMVEACLSCHYEHCPGPIKAINKLRL